MQNVDNASGNPSAIKPSTEKTEAIQFDTLSSWLSYDKVVAIGETGFDFYRIKGVDNTSNASSTSSFNKDKVYKKENPMDYIAIYNRLLGQLKFLDSTSFYKELKTFGSLDYSNCLDISRLY